MKHSNEYQHYFDDISFPNTIINNLSAEYDSSQQTIQIFDQQESSTSKVNQQAYSMTKFYHNWQSSIQSNFFQKENHMPVSKTLVKFIFQPQVCDKKLNSNRNQKIKPDFTLKKKELRNFLPTLKRCIIKCNEKSFQSFIDNYEIFQFLQKRKMASLNDINNLFQKEELLKSFAEMFLYRKLKRVFQVSRIELKNRNCFHRQIQRLKKSFLEGKLNCN